MSTVDIIVPSARGVLADSYASMVAMAQFASCHCGDHAPWKCTRGRHSVRIIPSMNISVVHWARNAHISLALYGPQAPERPPAEFFMMVDDDMTCGQDHLVKLLAHNKDIVTGIATVRQDPPQPNIRNWKPELGRYVTIAEWDYESKDLMQINAVGAAFMLVKRGVLKKMGQAYLNCFFERDEDKRKYPHSDSDIDRYWNLKSGLRLEAFDAAIKSKEWKSAGCYWFQFLDNVIDTQTTETGEDIGFCWKAEKLGYKIWADPQVLPGHIGTYAYGVWDHVDFMERTKKGGLVVPESNQQPAETKPIKHLTQEANGYTIVDRASEPEDRAAGCL